jgi:hypothetical protein
MPGPLFVGAEGVILHPDENAYAASRPINEGLELVMQLEKFPTSSLTILCNTESQMDAEYFVKMNGLPHARVVLTSPEDRNEWPYLSQWAAINRERAKGPVNLVLTSYREVWDRCVQSYQACLLFGRRGALSTIETALSWEQLHERVKATKEARLEEVPEGPGNRSEGF